MSPVSGTQRGHHRRPRRRPRHTKARALAGDGRQGRPGYSKKDTFSLEITYRCSHSRRPRQFLQGPGTEPRVTPSRARIPGHQRQTLTATFRAACRPQPDADATSVALAKRFAKKTRCILQIHMYSGLFTRAHGTRFGLQKEGTATRDISLTQKGKRHMTSQDQSTGKVAPG